MKPLSGPVNSTPTSAADRTAQVEKQLHDVAKLYEKQFLREMVKAMKATVSESGFIKSDPAEKIFKEELDHEYVEKWGEKGGIGLGDLIYNQLVERFGPSLGISAPLAKPVGPIKFSPKDMTSGQISLGSDQKKLTLRVESLPKEGAELINPWNGKLLSKMQISESNPYWLVKIEHDNGLESLLGFSGNLSKELLGQSPNSSLDAGFPLGHAKSSLSWNSQVSIK